MLTNMEHQVYTSYRKVPRSLLGKVSPAAVLLAGKIQDIACAAHGEFYLTLSTIAAFLAPAKQRQLSKGKARDIRNELLDAGYIVKAAGSRFSLGEAYRKNNCVCMRYPRVLDTVELTASAKLAYCVLLDNRLNNMFTFRKTFRCASVANQVMMPILGISSRTTLSTIYALLEDRKLIQRLTAQGMAAQIWITGLGKDVQFLTPEDVQKTAPTSDVQISTPIYKERDISTFPLKDNHIQGESLCLSNSNTYIASSDTLSKRGMDAPQKAKSQPITVKVSSPLVAKKDALIKQYPDKKDTIEAYIGLVDEVMKQDGGTVRVQGINLSVDKVQDKFARVTGEDLLALIDREIETDVKNIRAFRLTGLYTAYSYRGFRFSGTQNNSRTNKNYTLTNNYDYDAILETHRQRLYGTGTSNRSSGSAYTLSNNYDYDKILADQRRRLYESLGIGTDKKQSTQQTKEAPLAEAKKESASVPETKPASQETRIDSASMAKKKVQAKVSDQAKPDKVTGGTLMGLGAIAEEQAGKTKESSSTMLSWKAEPKKPLTMEERLRKIEEKRQWTAAVVAAYEAEEEAKKKKKLA